MEAPTHTRKNVSKLSLWGVAYGGTLNFNMKGLMMIETLVVISMSKSYDIQTIIYVNTFLPYKIGTK